MYDKNNKMSQTKEVCLWVTMSNAEALDTLTTKYDQQQLKP